MATHTGTVEFTAERHREEQSLAELRQRVVDRRQIATRAGVTGQAILVDQRPKFGVEVIILLGWRILLCRRSGLILVAEFGIRSIRGSSAATCKS